MATTPVSAIGDTDLFLFNTQVSDVSPLSGLTALYSLNLRGTQVRDVSTLAHVRELDLDGTQRSELGRTATRLARELRRSRVGHTNGHRN